MYTSTTWVYLQELNIMRQIVDCSAALEFERNKGQNHLQALQHAMALAEKSDVHIPHILRWHSELFEYGGATRTTQAVIVGSKCVTATPNTIAPRLLHCVDTINSGPSTWKAVAEAHLEFTTIHPFADGNGRVGRILLNYHTSRLNLGLVCLCPKSRGAYLNVLERRDVLSLADLFRKHNIES